MATRRWSPTQEPGLVLASMHASERMNFHEQKTTFVLKKRGWVMTSAERWIEFNTETW
jgi:hypothetical protein